MNAGQLSSKSTHPADSSVLPLVTLLHAGFVLTGIANTMLGPLLPLLSSQWQLSDMQAGNLFVAQFVGSMVGVTASSFIAPRRGPKAALTLGLVAMGAGSAGVGLTTWSTGIVPLFTLGVGLGLTIPTTNLLISELYSDKRAAALSLINLSWGVGAVLCPFIIAALQRSDHTLYLLYALAVLLLILTGLLIQTRFSVGRSHADKPVPGYRGASPWRSRYVPILGAIFFLYVGTEASVGGWIASYAKRAMPVGTIWVLTPSYFWASLLLGRAIAPLLLRRVVESWLSRSGLLVTLLGLITALGARNTIHLCIGTCLAGLGLSSVFPIAIAALSHKFGDTASRVAGLMFNLAGFGGATLPWLVGFTSTSLNSLRLGLLVPLIGCLTMLLLHLSFRTQRPVALTVRGNVIGQ